MARSNQKVVPEAKAALDKFKYEVASEVGGNMVRKLIQQAENNMK